MNGSFSRGEKFAEEGRGQVREGKKERRADKTRRRERKPLCRLHEIRASSSHTYLVVVSLLGGRGARG